MAVGIGSSAPVKQWGKERFADLSARLIEEQQAAVFLVGGPAERNMAQWIDAQLRKQGHMTATAIAEPVDQVTALLAECAVYVGNDTGMLNAAAAVETPAVGLFGASMPLRHSPHIHCVVPPGMDPMETAETGIYKGAAVDQGMQRITVAQVLAAIENIGVLQ